MYDNDKNLLINLNKIIERLSKTAEESAEEDDFEEEGIK